MESIPSLVQAYGICQTLLQIKKQNFIIMRDPLYHSEMNSCSSKPSIIEQILTSLTGFSLLCPFSQQ